MMLDLTIAQAAQEDTKQNYIALCVAVIKLALLEEGPGYLDTPGCQFWCNLAGIDPEYIKRIYSQFTS